MRPSPIGHDAARDRLGAVFARWPAAASAKKREVILGVRTSHKETPPPSGARSDNEQLSTDRPSAPLHIEADNK
jgi:hypothetical protein